MRTLFSRAMQRTTGRQTTAAILQRAALSLVIEHKRSIIREAVGLGAVDTAMQDLRNTDGDMVPPRFWVNTLLNREIHCDFDTEPYPAVVVQPLAVEDWGCFEDAVMRRVATLATLQQEALDYQMSEYNAADYEDFDDDYPDDSRRQTLEPRWRSGEDDSDLPALE